MSLHVFERTLLSLYSSPKALSEFMSEPSHFLDALDLSPIEKRAIAGIPRDRLKSFQHQLHHKSMDIARKMLRRERTLVLMSLHPRSPAAVWGDPGHPQTQTLSSGSYQILHRLARLKLPLTPTAILAEYSRAPESSWRDVFTLVRLATANRLLGAIIRIPLVL